MAYGFAKEAHLPLAPLDYRPRRIPQAINERGYHGEKETAPEKEQVKSVLLERLKRDSDGNVRGSWRL